MSEVVFTPSVGSVTGTDLVRWTMNDVANNGGVGIYLIAQSHVDLTIIIIGGWSSNSNHWANDNPETGGLKGISVR